MDDLARTEYPAMMAAIPPNQAVQVLNDRVKRIHKINIDIADWIQERRRVEDQYVMGMRKLSQFRVPNAASELGVFQGPWNRIVESVEGIAHSHHQFADRIERDIELPLRSFHQKKDFVNMQNISSNLTTMAKILEEAQHATEKLGKKGGKANTSKIDAASSKLESAQQQWDSQAPFIFETLQALDETRINQLRDLLTQYQTHEADCAARTQENSAQALTAVLEVSTESEIQNFATKHSQGRTRTIPTRTSTRRSSTQGTPPGSIAPPGTGHSSTAPPPLTVTEPPVAEAESPERQPDVPQAESKAELRSELQHKPESKLRRLGTMFGGRRRQSVIGGIGLSPQKTGSFMRSSKQERGVSPRASSSNLRETSSRLDALSETPDLPGTPEQEPTAKNHEDTNGLSRGVNLMDSPVPNGTSDLTAPVNDGRPQTSPGNTNAPVTKDSEGYSIPAPANDPISEAQKEAAAEEADQLFKLNIHQKPIEEEDPQEKMLALNNVANSLKIGPATRRSGTVRGRRDVRNTIYVPSVAASGAEGQGEAGVAAAAGLTTAPAAPGVLDTRPSAVAALASEPSITAGSDTQSVRSGHSLGSLAHFRHPEVSGPGLHASIIETISAVFEGGAVKSAAVGGEIAFVNYPTDADMFKTHESIRINNFASLERIGPNRIFVRNAEGDHPDQFTLDLSHLNKMSTAFSYRVFADDVEHLGQNAPLALNPVWKPQGDKLGLLLQYHLNGASRFEAPLTLHNVVFVATYEGRSTAAQTKPSGTHLKDKHIVYWRLGDLTLTDEVQKIVCRIVGADGVAPTPGHIEARWEYAVPSDELTIGGAAISISRLAEGKGKGKEVASADDDPFADESLSGAAQTSDLTWVDVPLSRKIVSGRYEST